MTIARILSIILALISLSLPGCKRMDAKEIEQPHHEQHSIWATSPNVQDVTITQEYVCQIHSCRHIEVCALESGYLEKIPLKEGQKVKQGDPLFTILPTLYQAKLDTEKAEAQLAQIEFDNTKKLLDKNVVSKQELALAQAKLDKAKAQVKLAEAELNFTVVKAPFDGIVDRLLEQQGSLVEEGEVLTTLSDNSLMWVYFNVPEARYLEYMASHGNDGASSSANSSADDDDDDDDDADDDDDDDADDDDVADSDANNKTVDETQIVLVLANGHKFPQTGTIGAIEADFNNETGNIAFRADFPNPDGVLRHGQTGKVLIHRIAKNALVIPQRATFEILDKRYVFVVGEDNVVHQREIVLEHEMDDIFVLQSGLSAGDKIVLEGVQQVHDGETLENYEFRSAEDALSNQKYHAE